MKKNVMKTMVATVCVVAAGMGGVKAYNATNQSKGDMLLAENVEALSQSEGGGRSYCIYCPGFVCYWDGYALLNHILVWE